MKRELMIAIAGTALAVAGLSGCSGDKSSSPNTASSSKEGATSVGAGSPAAKVTVDGQNQNAEGTVACTTAGGSVNIAIGGGTSGVAAVLTDADPPEVTSVGLGTVNGVALVYQSGVNQGNAEATKDGNRCKITGTAVGADMSNPMQQVNKPFEIDVTCP